MNIEIEFFHDVLCSYCFPTSYQMRLFTKKYPDVIINHKSFALVYDESDFRQFGSRQEAKSIIVTHWIGANKLDELKRFEPEKMLATDFLFPMSMPVLKACVAAEMVQANSYWDVFDALQAAMFMNAQNINDLNVIESCIINAGIDLKQWTNKYDSEDVLHKINADFKLGNDYGINVVPTIIINKKIKLSGFCTVAMIEKAIASL